MISKFSGEHRFLSNFWFHAIPDGEVYHPTVEHYFQAKKCLDPADAEAIRVTRSPSEAKRLGRKVPMRPDWDSVKLGVMREGLRLKFLEGSLLATKLIATHPHVLQEGNHWGDRFWGVDGHGENWLGVLLMARRAELMEAYSE